MLERRSDKELERRVRLELKWDSRINWGGVSVDVKDGVVTLTGAVPTYLQKLEAQSAAHRVVGVLDVANDIEVKADAGIARTDTQIAGEVRNALEWAALVPNELIQSSVSDGWVTLEGEVDYGRERTDAEEAIRRLTGVVGVTNNITVRRRPIDARDLRRQIELALERRADREAQRLRVEIKDGAVDLYGRVHSWQERRAVLGSIVQTPGVAEIRDHLRIDPYF